MSLMAKFKLGKKAPKIDERTLQLVNYMPVVIPATPRLRYWSRAMTNVGIVLNDKLGICAIATIVHMIQNFTANAGRQIIISDAEALKVYSYISGYDPNAQLDAKGENPTDTGCCVLDVLKYWKKYGIVDVDGNVHKILAFAQVDPTNLDQCRIGINVFEGLYLGLALPKFIDELPEKALWTPDSKLMTPEDLLAGGLGGHAVPALDFDQDQGQIDNCTWGYMQGMSDEFFTNYTDEAYIVVTQDQVDAKGLNPLGIDLKALLSDMAAVSA
jgi:hypothetical protein